MIKYPMMNNNLKARVAPDSHCFSNAYNKKNRTPKSEKMMIDFDETLWPLTKAMSSFPGYEHVSLENCLMWEDLFNLVGNQEELNYVFSKVMKLDAMQKIGPYAAANAVIQELHQEGVEIHIVTHRDIKHLNDTESFLQYYKIPFNYFVCDPDIDKVNYCVDKSIDTIIDDKPSILKSAHNKGLHALSLVKPYNISLIKELSIPKTYHWQDLRDELFVDG